MATAKNLALVAEIFAELDRANALHGKFNSTHEGISVIREEYLELEKEIFWGNPMNARSEAVQMAAMCIKMIRLLETEVREP